MASPAPARWTVVIEAEDGSLSVIGPFSSEWNATLYANAQETPESGFICHVRPLESK